MAVTWRTIQTLARDLAQDEDLDVTSSAGLVVGMRVYRRFAAMWRWPELYRTNSTLTTAAVQEKYSATALATFRDIVQVEVEDDRDGDKFAPVAPVNSVPRWLRAGYQDPSFPDLYMMESSEGVPKIGLRPAPNTAQAANTIRVSGYTTPADISATETTFPRNTLADDVLAHYLAADRLKVKGQDAKANELLSRAGELFQRLTGQEIVPAELAVKKEE